MKLLVIGGGPAGLCAAAEAAGRGLDVTLFEKGRIGENIKCAEGFFDTMKLLGEPSAGVRFKVKQIIIKAKSTHKVDASRLNLWMIDRPFWQKALAKQAESNGVKIKENSLVQHKELAKLKNKYDYIIDASGAPSVTSRAYGFSNFYKRSSGKTVQYTMEGDFSHIENCLKVGLMPDFWGYYWIFPKGKSIANVGVGDFYPVRNDRLWVRLDRVMEEEGLSDHIILRKIGGICPTAIPEKLKHDNILLVGDAAGLTSPLHGGGIDMAVISATEAIKAIISGESYDKNLRAVFATKLKFERLLVALWRQRNLDEMDRLIANLEKYRIYHFVTNPNLINDASIKLMEKVLLKKQPAV
ncbi:MAG TPA: NAD(P)/FAD-dependent oxidoreductase [Thermoanaerobacterales bacterium]|nr:NAD(P)/FAD-dependent oxidoreductase [Thermoanaerobacterales bacterium]